VHNARALKGWGLGMGAVACILIRHCVNHYAKLSAQLACYFNQFIVLDTTLQLVGYSHTKKMGRQSINYLGCMHFHQIMLLGGEWSVAVQVW